MEWLSQFIHFFLHIDQYLIALIQTMGHWVYALLFLIIFLESGAIITPILPGESMLFAAGSLSAVGALNRDLLFVLLAVAAVSGGFVNFFIGKYIGEKILASKRLNKLKGYIQRTHDFYEKYGAMTILIARLIPIIRTYAPFVAGVAKMRTRVFSFYNTVGGIAWIGFFIYIGYFFGNIQFVKNNFSFFILGIIVVSIVTNLI
ncbi:MAG: VTT domain-containing protein [Pseudomonadota bacterium]